MRQSLHGHRTVPLSQGNLAPAAYCLPSVGEPVNATGCSSIYGGNLPTTPWAKNGEGKGPAWSNSLFEDNAEFGFGFRLTADQHHGQAVAALQVMKGELGAELVDTLINAPQRLESEIRAQRGTVAQVRERLEEVKSGKARELLSLID